MKNKISSATSHRRKNSTVRTDSSSTNVNANNKNLSVGLNVTDPANRNYVMLVSLDVRLINDRAPYWFIVG